MATMTFEVVVTTREQMERAFRVWNEHYQANPEEYVPMAEFNPVEATDYFLHLIRTTVE